MGKKMDLMGLGYSRGKKINREKERADNEAERAKTRGDILESIENSIVDDASYCRKDQPRFYDEIKRRQKHGGEECVLNLVTALIKELEGQRRAKKGLEISNEQLWQECKLAGIDNEAIQNYERRTAIMRGDMRRENQELNGKIYDQAKLISQLETENNSIERDRQAMMSQHQGYIQQLQFNLSQISQVRENKIKSDLETMRNADKREWAKNHGKEMRDLEINLEQNYNAEKTHVQAQHNAEREALISRITALEQTLDDERMHQQYEISDIKRNYAEEKGRLKGEFESRRKEFKERLSVLENMHKDEMSQLEQEHRSMTDQKEQEHGSIIAKIDREHKSRQTELISRMSQMETEHASEQKKMRSDFDSKKLQLEHQTGEQLSLWKADFMAKKAKLELVHAEETKKLRKDIDEYSTALLKRDDFIPMPDKDIKAKFMDLVQGVEALARLEWRVDEKAWTSQVLQHLSQDQRLFKKQILQDVIWVTLHSYVFCSPFRVLGEEGQSLETQWNTACGKDPQLDNGIYTWPKPSTETERWRYVTVKECRAALKQPVPSEWDPRAKLKKGFKTSMDALREELISMLGEVANLEESAIQIIDKIAKKAAVMWLEFGMQRCRILVVLEGSNLKLAKQKIQKAKEDTLELVVLPELKRFGNSKGQELHTEVTIDGCDGETVELSRR